MSCSRSGAASSTLRAITRCCVLHDVLPTRLRAAILLGAFVGLRVAEACGLRVADAGAAAARVGQDNARHVRAPVARPGRIHTSGRERRAGRAGGESCGFCAD
jgi:integrase